MASTTLYANEQQTDAPQRAAGSSFYTAMRLLPRRKREAMYEIYAFCRAVDDIADSDAPHDVRQRQLATWRADVEAIYSGHPPAKLRNLAAVVSEFGLRKEDLLAVIDGMEMDAAEDIRAPAWDKLDLYCDRVASAVGRMSVRVFGMEGAQGIQLAHHLGRALQLTNILRDIDEDAAIGRLYLPREALDGAGITSRDPRVIVADARLGNACDAVVERAKEHFAAAKQIMRQAPSAVVRAPRIMGDVYRAILDGMIARGWSLPRERVRPSKPKIIWIILRSFV
jgi:phytoene synthase